MASIKCKSWVVAYGKYDWTVNLAEFIGARDYPSFFNLVIRPEDTVTFENSFRMAIDEVGSFEIAGEVCFWKNYGT